MRSYKQKTPHFEIPVVGQGDRISPDKEMRKYTIIENMLIAGTLGMSDVIFDDGDYVLESNGEEYLVHVGAGGNYPSVEGMVGGFYFRGPARVVWEGLKPGFFYYLYVRPTPSTPYENWSIRTTSSTYLLGKGAVLVATVDLQADPPIVNPNPDGKIYSEDVGRHAADNSNPHGRQLEQDELTVKKTLVISEDAQIQIGDKLIPADEFVATAESFAGRHTEVIDFKSGGTEGIVLKASGKVRFVQAQECWSNSTDFELAEIRAGEVGIGYFGDDDKADEECEFVVYNMGNEGVPMRALVHCG